MVKTKLRLIACAILLVVSVNASATMAPVATRTEAPVSNNDILLLISGLEIYGPVAITDCRFKLLAASIELDHTMLPAEIHDLIVNTIDNICPNQYTNTLTASFDVAPEPIALQALAPHTSPAK